MTRFVYFMRPVGIPDAPVKIGCSQEPEGRLATMMAWSPFPLAIIARMEGSEDLERRFHAHLMDSWSHGEWFRATAAVLTTLESIQAGTFDLGLLPAKGKRPGAGRGMPRGKWSAGMRYRSRLNRLLYRSGIKEPEDVTHAGEVFDRLSGAEQVAARELIEAHLSDPVARGRLLDTPWAISEYSAWAKKHGAPPLTIAKAA